MTSVTSWRRAALNRSASVSGSVAAAERRPREEDARGGARRATCRPARGSGGRRGRGSRDASRGPSAWVVLPAPSGPSMRDEPATSAGAPGRRHGASVADGARPDRGHPRPAPAAYPFGMQDRRTAGGSAPTTAKTCRDDPGRRTMTRSLDDRAVRDAPRCSPSPRWRVLVAARRRGRASARQLHDQPLRRDPGRARSDPARRRHRPGRDPDLPGTPRLRHRRRRRGLRRRDRRRPRGRLRFARAVAGLARRRDSRCR